jgi:uncharacterized protein
MKRRSADRLDWRRVSTRRFCVRRIVAGEFRGYVSLLQIGAVSEPLWIDVDGQRICIADTGYDWVQHFPDDAQHTLTTMFDASGAIVQWYVDIVARHGMDERGVPWFDDLYLDLVIVPPCRVLILDQDELDTARDTGIISVTEHGLAWREVERLVPMIEAGAWPLLDLCHTHRALLNDES